MPPGWGRFLVLVVVRGCIHLILVVGRSVFLLLFLTQPLLVGFRLLQFLQQRMRARAGAGGCRNLLRWR